MQFDQLPQFKIGCASIHKIMSNSRSKIKAEKVEELKALIAFKKETNDKIRDGLASKIKGKEVIEKLESDLVELQKTPDTIELSETTKTYCRLWLKSYLYEKKQLFTSKYTEKGNLVEDDSIAYIEVALKWDNEFVKKNELKKENDFLKGICDVNLRKRIIDTKNSYDCFTFPLFDDENCDENYEWQAQGYMELYNKPTCEIIYVLMDTPDEIIEKEAKWKLGSFFTEEQYLNFRLSYMYSQCPDKLRIRRFKFERDEAKIEQIRQRVIQCRAYIETKILELKKRDLND